MTEIHYFAAARAARGLSREVVDAPGTLAELLDRLIAASPDNGVAGLSLAEVFARCSFLLDGQSVTDTSAPVSGVARVDVLPPFAGG